MIYINKFLSLFLDFAPYLMFGFFLAGVLHVFLPKEKATRLMGKAGFFSSLKAALIGIPLPLCSCSVVPTAVSLKKNGASKGASMSFLISTPQTGVDSVVVAYSFLGPIYAFFRVIFAFISGVFGGFIYNVISKKDKPCPSIDNAEKLEKKTQYNGIKAKTKEIFRYGFSELFHDISLHLIIGLIIATGISTFIPDNFFNFIGSGIAGKLIMIAAGIPMYVCSTASIPIAVAMILKGISPGTAFVFLMAGPATNAASLIVISKSFGKKFSAILIASVLIFSIAGGYLLDFVYSLFPNSFNVKNITHNAGLPKIVIYILSVILGIMLIYSIIRKLYFYIKLKRTNKNNSSCSCTSSCSASKSTKNINNEKIELFIKEMDCSSCKEKISDFLDKYHGINNFSLSQIKRKAIIHSNNIDIDELILRLKDVGYTAVLNNEKEIKHGV